MSRLTKTNVIEWVPQRKAGTWQGMLDVARQMTAAVRRDESAAMIDWAITTMNAAGFPSTWRVPITADQNCVEWYARQVLFFADEISRATKAGDAKSAAEAGIALATNFCIGAVVEQRYGVHIAVADKVGVKRRRKTSTSKALD